METKKICQKLNQFLDEINWGGKQYIDLSLFCQAADRLEELEKQNEAMMKELCDKEDLVREAEGRFYELEKELDTLKNAKKPEPEWISVEDDLPKESGKLYWVYRKNGSISLAIFYNEKNLIGAMEMLLIGFPCPNRRSRRSRHLRMCFWRSFRKRLSKMS